MFALPCFVLAVLALPFKSKSRPEAENVALRQQLIVFGVRCAAGPDLQTAITGFIQLYRWFPSIPQVVPVGNQMRT
jgi:hypothetical protein